MTNRLGSFLVFCLAEHNWSKNSSSSKSVICKTHDTVTCLLNPSPKKTIDLLDSCYDFLRDFGA